MIDQHGPDGNVLVLEDLSRTDDFVRYEQGSRISPPFIVNAQIDVEGIEFEIFLRHFDQRRRAERVHRISQRGAPSEIEQVAVVQVVI